MDSPHSRRSIDVPWHPRFTRRVALQAGAIGLLGLGMNHLEPLRAGVRGPRCRDGSGHAEGQGGHLHLPVRRPVATGELRPQAGCRPRESAGSSGPSRPGRRASTICEHLPRLAERSHLWALVRSLTHASNDHSAGHHIMLTGRTDLPPGFDPNRPRPSDWPSMAAIAGALTASRNNLPPAVVLPEKLVHNTGGSSPGSLPASMGPSARPLVHRGVPVRSGGVRGLSDVRVRPPGRPRTATSAAVPGTQPGLARRTSRRARCRGRLSLLRSLDRQRAALDPGRARDVRPTPPGGDLPADRCAGSARPST